MRHWQRNQDGSMAVLMALVFPLLVAAAALGVDVATLNYQKRVLQAGVDMAAIAAVQSPDRAFERAVTALSDAGIVSADVIVEDLSHTVGGPLLVETGRYAADPDLTIAERFDPAGAGVNAVRVRMEQPGRLYFASALGIASPPMSASAVAAVSPRAAFSIGSRLANLDAGLANALLGSLLGTGLSLSLADYNGLANLDIALGDFLDALAGRIGISAGTYGQVLAADIGVGDIAAALALAGSGADAGLAAILLDLAGLIDDSIMVEMVRLIVAEGLAEVGLGEPHAGLEATFDAFSLFSAAVFAADGTSQAGAAIGLSVPGLAGANMRLAVGQPPQSAWFTLGPTGSFVRSAQIRLRLDIGVAGQGGPGIGLINITLPVYLELASAQARLTALHCPHGPPDTWHAQIAAQPGIARLVVGQPASGGFSDMSQPLVFAPVPIVTVAGLARIRAGADIAVAQTHPVTLAFSHADMMAGTKKTVGTTTPVSGLGASLVSSLDLQVEVLGIGLLGGLLGGLLNSVNALLAPLGPAIDALLVDLLGALGIGLGEADIWLNGFDCRAPVLVQ